MNEIFRTWHRVRFGECDHAGIVFYPRYGEMSHAVIESAPLPAAFADKGAKHLRDLLPGADLIYAWNEPDATIHSGTAFLDWVKDGKQEFQVPYSLRMMK